ncbi:DNA-directed RNA polymerase I subunit RPA34.5-domain-containing protein [Coniochaeta sp. 2T2.1]|nr:DNA-directed RNA polymerase I subunit RPA34.5-domain-containing protein [Coniochaeta sp. 2T2.1]
MAGPKAPIGSLKGHAEKSSALARGASNNKLASTSAATKRANLKKEESESDSSSDSDSDASDSGDIDHDTVLREIASKASGPKSKAETKVSAPAAKKTALKKQDSSSDESSSESESDSDDESDDDKKKAAEPSKGAKLEKKLEASSDKSKAKAVKKTESEDESESDSSSSESSSESESEEEETPAKKAVAKPTETKKQSKPDASSSSSSSSEASSSDSDEEADESMAIDDRNGNNALVRNQVPEIVANEFHLRKAEDGTNAADVAQFFSEAKKEGKQIWYFTTPASIPIEVVEKLEIPLERAQKGQSILSHNGDDYGVAFEDAATSRAIKLLIPSKAGDKYRMLDAPVAQTMHLKRVTQFSQDGESTLSLTQTAAAPSRSYRPQPKGLKARFQPIGIPSSAPVKIGSDASDEDVDMAEAPALPSSQKTPAKKSKSKDADTTDKKKKRKLDVATDEPAADTPEPSKKSKKARVEAQPTPKTKPEISSSQPGKVTPILPPAVPSLRLPSSSQTAPASTPSSSKTSKAKAAAMEPTSSAVKKESAIPLPSNFRRSSSSFSSQAVEEPKTNGKAKKEKKSKTIKPEAASEAPKKTTPVPVPNFPSS